MTTSFGHRCITLGSTRDLQMKNHYGNMIDTSSMESNPKGDAFKKPTPFGDL